MTLHIISAPVVYPLTQDVKSSCWWKNFCNSLDTPGMLDAQLGAWGCRILPGYKLKTDLSVLLFESESAFYSFVLAWS